MGKNHLTVIFSGRLCQSPIEGSGHARLSAAELLHWLNSGQPQSCGEFLGDEEAEAVVAAPQAQLIARQVFGKLGLTGTEDEPTVAAKIREFGSVSV